MVNWAPFKEAHTMTATDAQVRKLMRERRRGRTQEQAATSANLRSRKTVRKYERLGQLPSAPQEPPRVWLAAYAAALASARGVFSQGEASSGALSLPPPPAAAGSHR